MSAQIRTAGGCRSRWTWRHCKEVEMPHNKQKKEIYHICCTSIDDARSTIASCDDIAVLQACIAYEKETGARKTMIQRLECRVRRLEQKE